MKKNMGGVDKFLRLIIAAIIIALYLLGKISGTLGIVLLVVAVVLLIVSLVGSCPLYLPFGISTLPKEKK
ncbi:YgaP-like transmembrane domain [Flavobacterium sp.]|uniref:YgaP-like transmembrane domain n=1 Tax=Flavobacterium sp. TaxID=239 RepID=UPI0038D13050